jgi:hypothetical protein
VLLTPATQAGDAAQTRYEAALGATAILIAAERHRRKSGDWPASIAAIDPVFLPNPLLDPYTGQAYRMERHDGQFLIYSVGENLKDDHGAVSDPKRYPRKKDDPDDVGTRAWDLPLRRMSSEEKPAAKPG